MELMIVILYIWVISYMIFHMNPLNHRTNPLSEMNHFHNENIQGREELDTLLEVSDTCEKEVIIYWADIWPYVSPTLVTILCVFIIIFAREIPAF